MLVLQLRLYILVDVFAGYSPHVVLFLLHIGIREEILQFVEHANSHHPTIKFTAEASETETTFLDTTIYKGERFLQDSILDVRTHFKPTETFPIHTFHFISPSGSEKRFHQRRGSKTSQNKLF